jgi:putative phosphoesterase
MKIGIVSDVHCNAPGLARALEVMGDVDEVLCAGDAVYEYRFSNDVIRIIRDRGIRLVQGNHDMVLLGPHGQRARATEGVDQGLVAFLGEAPFRMETKVNGKRLLMVHGNPYEPWNQYVVPSSPAFKRLAELDTDFVILGHTHMPVAACSGRVLVINPGSAGEARDPKSGFQLSCAILDTETDEVRIESFPDPQREARGLAI